MKKKLYMGLLIALICIMPFFIIYYFFATYAYIENALYLARWLEDYLHYNEYINCIFSSILAIIDAFIVIALLAAAICLLVCVCKGVKPDRKMTLAFAILVIIFNILLIVCHSGIFYIVIESLTGSHNNAGMVSYNIPGIIFNICEAFCKILFNALVIVGASFWIRNIQTDFLRLTPEERAQKKAEEAEMKRQAEIAKLQARLNELQNGENPDN